MGRGEPYDVFISHAGQDKQFAAYIFNSFQARHPHVNVFLDERCLLPGGAPTPAMEAAMDQSSVAIFLLSPHFLRKAWPMEELKRFIDRLEKNQDQALSLLPVLYKVTCEDIYKLPGGYDRAWPQDEDASKPDATTLQKWAELAQKLINGHTGLRIDQVKFTADLQDAIVDEAIRVLDTIKPMMDTTLPPEKDLVDVHWRMQPVLRALQKHKVLLLHGPGGVGKTVLAKLVYQDLARTKLSGQKRAFLRIEYDQAGQATNITSQQTKLLRKLGEQQRPEDPADGRDKLQKLLQHQKLLVVVDNVWGDALSCLLPGDMFSNTASTRVHTDSILIATSRDREVPHTLGACFHVHEVGLLSDEDAKDLLLQGLKAKQDKNQYVIHRTSIEAEDITTHIHNLCGRLPMAISSAASFFSRQSYPVWREYEQQLVRAFAMEKAMHRTDGEAKELFSVHAQSYRLLDERRAQDAVFDVAWLLKGARRCELAAYFETGIMANLEQQALVRIDTKGHVVLHETLLQFCKWTTGSTGETNALRELKRQAMLPSRRLALAASSQHTTVQVDPQAVHALHVVDVQPPAPVDPLRLYAQLKWLSVECNKLEPGQQLSAAGPELTRSWTPRTTASMCNALHLLDPALPVEATVHATLLRPKVDIQQAAPVPVLLAVLPRLQRAQPHELLGTQFSTAFGSMASLRSLHLAGLTNTRLELPAIPSLICLSLSNMDQLTTVVVPCCENLQSVLVSSCPVLSSLAGIGQESRRLYHLEMVGCHNMMGMPELANVPDVLQTLIFQDCPMLETLDVGQCKQLIRLHLSTCRAICSLALGGCCSLQQLDLRQLDSLPGLDLGPCAQLSQVKLDSCNLLTYLQFGAHSSLVELTIQACPLLAALPTSSLLHLKVLHVQDCAQLQIRSAIASGSLVALKVDDCLLVESLTLSGCSQLHEVDLQGTSLTSLEVRDCAKLPGLAGCSGLKQLRVEGCNGITELQLLPCIALTALTVLACSNLRNVALATHQTLEELHLCHCRLLRHLSLESCSSLSKVAVDGCPYLESVHLVGCESLCEALLKNCGILATVNSDGCTQQPKIVYIRCPKVSGLECSFRSGMRKWVFKGAGVACGIIELMACRQVSR